MIIIIIISYFLQKTCWTKMSSPVCCLLPSVKWIVHFHFQLQFPKWKSKVAQLLLLLLLSLLLLLLSLSSSSSLRKNAITVTARSQAYICSRLMGLWVPVPPGAWTPVSFECCVLSGKRSLRWGDHPSRGVLQRVVCLGVIVEPRHWRSPGPLGAVAPCAGGE